MRRSSITLLRHCFFPLILLLFAAANAAQGANLGEKDLRIGVVTMAPGRLFYERFGHDALVVLDRRSNQAISYNFGYFDPQEPGFITRFIQGQMQYFLVALPLQEDLEQYAHEGRSVRLQWLNLTDPQAQRLASRLAMLSKPEFARYHYDYLTANCATKVRDSLDLALEGTLARQLAGSAGGQTYRKRVLALAAADSWMEILLDLGLGPSADQPLTQWQDMFIPMQLAQRLEHLHTASKDVLITQSTPRLDQHVATKTWQSHPLWWWIVGIIGAACLLGLSPHPRTSALLAGFIWLLCTLAGWLLLLLWLCTDHRATWMNANLLLLNPLCLITLFDLPRIWKGLAPTPLSWAIHWLVVVCCGVGLALHVIQAIPQQNLTWIGLIAPLHAAQTALRHSARLSERKALRSL